MDDKTFVGSKSGEVKHLPAETIGRPEARTRSENNVGLAGPVAAVLAIGRTDEQIIEAVAVDIAGRRDAGTGHITIVIHPAALISLYNEALTRRECFKIDDSAPIQIHAKADVGPKHHISFPSVFMIVGAYRVGLRRTNNQIRKAVAVDVTGRGNTKSGFVTRGLALDDETFRRGQSG